MPRLPEFPIVTNYDLDEIQPTKLGFGLVTLRPHQPVPAELYLYLPNACLLYRRGKKSVHLPVTPFHLMTKAKELYKFMEYGISYMPLLYVSQEQIQLTWEKLEMEQEIESQELIREDKTRC